MGKTTRSEARIRRHARVRKHVSGTAEKPRMSVFRSLADIYVQVLDDQQGVTLVSASSIDHDLRKKMKGQTKVQEAEIVGQVVAERAKAKGIQNVVFDRGGFQYIGRVKALAEAARKAGLEF